MWLHLLHLLLVVSVHSYHFRSSFNYVYPKNNSFATDQLKRWNNGERNEDEESLFCQKYQSAVKCYLTDRSHENTLDEFIEDKDAHWEWFKNKFNKDYTDVEEMERRNAFYKNRNFVIKHNVKFMQSRRRFRVKLNQFADWTEADVHGMNRLLKQARQERDEEVKIKTPVHVDGPWKFGFMKSPTITIGSDGLPTSIDWREHGYVTEVRNQGKCFGCYSFGGLGALEGQLKRVTGKLIPLSEQNILDCSWRYNRGCDGGFINGVFKYVAENDGVSKYSWYPFVGKSSRICKYHKEHKGGSNSAYKDVPKGDEQKLKEAVAKIGPIAAGIHASLKSFVYYHHGVYLDPNCSKNVDHAILIVGYGTDPQHGDYWIIKNSWGKSWGMHGYALIARNKGNMCGIASLASYPVI